MSRLISTGELHNVVTKRKDEYGRLAVEVDNIVEEMVKETPTAQAIRLDKIKKARDEMESKLYKGATSTEFIWRNAGVNMCLEIIDKLIESEG